MFERAASFATLAIVLLLSLTIAIVSTAAVAQGHSEHVLQPDKHSKHSTMIEGNCDGQHSDHSKTDLDATVDPHANHSNCHMGLCCVMDGQHYADQTGAAGEFDSQANFFSKVVHASLVQMLPDRPPRNS